MKILLCAALLAASILPAHAARKSGTIEPARMEPSAGAHAWSPDLPEPAAASDEASASLPSQGQIWATEVHWVQALADSESAGIRSLDISAPTYYRLKKLASAEEPLPGDRSVIRTARESLRAHIQAALTEFGGDSEKVAAHFDWTPRLVRPIIAELAAVTVKPAPAPAAEAPSPAESLYDPATATYGSFLATEFHWAKKLSPSIGAAQKAMGVSLLTYYKYEKEADGHPVLPGPERAEIRPLPEAIESFVSAVWTHFKGNEAAVRSRLKDMAPYVLSRELNKLRPSKAAAAKPAKPSADDKSVAKLRKKQAKKKKDDGAKPRASDLPTLKEFSDRESLDQLVRIWGPDLKRVNEKIAEANESRNAGWEPLTQAQVDEIRAQPAGTAREHEKAFLRERLKAAGGDRAGAAETLGIPLSVLENKLRQHGLL